jgi:S1-C subfamily serine protease
MRMLKIAGVAVFLTGVAALAIVATPMVHGQTVRRAPAVNVQTHLFGGPYIGVAVRDVDEADVSRAQLSAVTGAVVDEVRSGTPAAEAGLRAGDVITRFDGERVRSARHFERLVAETPAGRDVEMTVVRAGQNITVSVAPEPAPGLADIEPLRSLRYSPHFNFGEIEELRRLPETISRSLPDLQFHFQDPGGLVLWNRGRLGVGIQDLTDQLGEYFGAPEGVLVTSVDEDSPASAAGLRAGDVITRINGEAVRTTSDLRRRLNAASGETTITIVRDKREQTVTTTLESGRIRERRIIR